jgi:hypothetical protein
MLCFILFKTEEAKCVVPRFDFDLWSFVFFIVGLRELGFVFFCSVRLAFFRAGACCVSISYFFSKGKKHILYILVSIRLFVYTHWALFLCSVKLVVFGVLTF